MTLLEAVPAVPVEVGLKPALSPSRASDFKSCPQRFKFRVVDRLPEAPSVYTARGTLVHAALEDLFLLTPAERTLAVALEIFAARRAEAEAAGLLEGLFVSSDDVTRCEGDCRRVIENYFHLEDPATLEPVAREARLHAHLPGTPDL